MSDDSLVIELKSNLNPRDNAKYENSYSKSKIIKRNAENTYIEDVRLSFEYLHKNYFIKFIEIWQSIFNRRIINFYKFTIQVGDVLFFISIVGYLVLSCLLCRNEKNSGEQTQFMLGVTIVFGCRNGLISYIFGLSFERAIFWHKFMAWVTLGLSANHWYHARGIVSGYIIGGVLSTFVIFSIEPIRRKFWEFFMKLHWLLICCMLVSCIIHEVGAGILAIGYFALDVISRIYTVKKYSNLSASIEIERIGNNVVKISLYRENITFKGGQYFFIMIPKLSYFQWHPFSAFSAPHEEQLVFYVKQSGDWTEALFQLAGKQDKPVTVRGYIDGPYGSHSISIERDKYQHFLCISGGIGITPIFSLIKQLNFQVHEGRLVQNIHFIWVGRDKSVIQNILDEKQLNQIEIKDSKIKLRSYIHFTNSKAPNVITQKQKLKQKNIKYILGRPEFSVYFENMHKLAKKSQIHLVGVLVCGPQSLIQIVEKYASQYSKDGIRFDIHQEVFEL